MLPDSPTEQRIDVNGTEYVLRKRDEYPFWNVFVGNEMTPLDGDYTTLGKAIISAERHQVLKPRKKNKD